MGLHIKGERAVMPKINVYLPDELADAVKEAGIPVSAVCQRALEQSARWVSAIRATALDELSTADATDQLNQFTDRARRVVSSAVERARTDGAAEVGTEHLLHGLLTEEGNLALHVLRVLEVAPETVARTLAQRLPEAGGGAGLRFSTPAANALERTVSEAIGLGHNYVGGEHLLLGLVAETDGVAGEVLRQAGLDLRGVRRAVHAALTGYAHLRAQVAAQPNPGAAADPTEAITGVLRRELQPLLDRITRLEQRTGVTE